MDDLLTKQSAAHILRKDIKMIEGEVAIVHTMVARTIFRLVML